VLAEVRCLATAGAASPQGWEGRFLEMLADIVDHDGVVAEWDNFDNLWAI